MFGTGMCAVEDTTLNTTVWCHPLKHSPNSLLNRQPTVWTPDTHKGLQTKVHLLGNHTTGTQNLRDYKGLVRQPSFFADHRSARAKAES